MKLTETKKEKSANEIHLNNMLFAIKNATMKGSEFFNVMESYKALSDALIPK